MRSLSPPRPQASDAQEGEAAAASDPPSGGTYFLGRYRVVDEIGVGGMASVHLARMDGPGGFQKWVAIKRIHPHLVEDETFVNMFLDEARVAARISHPNVATVFELGKHEDTYWIAMEYLHGEPLREVMRRTEEVGQPMPPEIACRVIADAAEGLHAAHELLGRNGEKMGLVHRDVTPHNLFVTYDGSTKVVDFGIAKFTSRMASTRAGTLKGKLAYMSPEQVAGEPIDRRTDVFATGVVLWELTTGQRLFRMENDLDTLARVQECVVPSPSTIVRGYPIDLEKIVMKALAKAKNERYRTARELSRALQSLLMRRGLFIASDEVASYMVSVFGERIQKREAHLRWAADVTQTIDLDKIAALAATPWQGEEGSILTYNSEVQPAQPAPSRESPRPAAGMPAQSASSESPESTQPPPSRAHPNVSDGPVVASRRASPPVDNGFEDPPTLALPRSSSEEPTLSQHEPDDAGDTIVNGSLPDLRELLFAAAPTRAVGDPAGPASTLATAASSVASGSGPRAEPPSLPAPSPAVAIVPPTSPLPIGPYRLENRQGSFAAPPGFAAPAGSDESRKRTVPARRRRLPPGALAVGAVIGLIALATVVVLLGRSVRRGQARADHAGAVPPVAPVYVVAAAPSAGPFVSARLAFASMLVAGTPTAAPSAGSAPDPSPSSLAPTASPPPSPPTPIPTTDVASLPTAASRSTATGRPAAAPPAATSPPSGGAGSGTLRVICFPGCDQVIDNGTPLGRSPIVRRAATLGSHRLKLVWSDTSKVVSTVVLADQTATVRENHP